MDRVVPIVTSYLSPTTGVLTVTGMSSPVTISVQTDLATEFHSVFEWNTLRGECAITAVNQLRVFAYGGADVVYLT